VAGYTGFGAGSLDAWVLKIDPSGAIIWQKSHGSSAGEYAYSIAATSDGGYIVGGAYYAYPVLTDALVFKIDGTGNLVWKKTYGGDSYDIVYSVVPLASGGYIAAGSTHSFGSGNDDAWVLKLDDLGNVVWQEA
jgi:hypothetical protein